MTQQLNKCTDKCFLGSFRKRTVRKRLLSINTWEKNSVILPRGRVYFSRQLGPVNNFTKVFLRITLLIQERKGYLVSTKGVS
jgi:hypothetical protein